MNFRTAGMALLASLLSTAVVAPQSLCIAFGGPVTTVRSAIVAYGVLMPSAEAAPVVQPAQPADDSDGQVNLGEQQAAEPRFAGPGPGWG